MTQILTKLMKIISRALIETVKIIIKGHYDRTQYLHIHKPYTYLDKAVLCKSHKPNGNRADKAAGNGDEATQKDKQRQNGHARDLEQPHARSGERRVDRCNLRL